MIRVPVRDVFGVTHGPCTCSWRLWGAESLGGVERPARRESTVLAPSLSLSLNTVQCVGVSGRAGLFRSREPPRPKGCSRLYYNPERAGSLCSRVERRSSFLWSSSRGSLLSMLRRLEREGGGKHVTENRGEEKWSEGGDWVPWVFPECHNHTWETPGGLPSSRTPFSRLDSGPCPSRGSSGTGMLPYDRVHGLRVSSTGPSNLEVSFRTRDGRRSGSRHRFLPPRGRLW